MQSRAQGNAHTKSRFALRAAFSSFSLLTFSLTLAAGGTARVSTSGYFQRVRRLQNGSRAAPLRRVESEAVRHGVIMHHVLVLSARQRPSGAQRDASRTRVSGARRKNIRNHKLRRCVARLAPRRVLQPVAVPNLVFVPRPGAGNAAQRRCGTARSCCARRVCAPARRQGATARPAARQTQHAAPRQQHATRGTACARAKRAMLPDTTCLSLRDAGAACHRQSPAGPAHTGRADASVLIARSAARRAGAFLPACAVRSTARGPHAPRLPRTLRLGACLSQ
jgi:hypothetical protein